MTRLGPMVWDESRNRWVAPRASGQPRPPLAERKPSDWQRRDRAARPEVHRDKNRAHNLRRMYGITPEDYDRMRAEQDYRCAICQRHEEEIPVSPAGRPRADGSRPPRFPLVVDHCHATGTVRKLLCDRCNHVIGHAGESIRVLEAAIQYLS